MWFSNLIDGISKLFLMPAFRPNKIVAKVDGAI